MDPSVLGRAEALFARKMAQKAEGVIAFAEYQEKQRAKLANMERLRLLRRAKPAAAPPSLKLLKPLKLKRGET
jgi:hypothetical protein